MEICLLVLIQVHAAACECSAHLFHNKYFVSFFCVFACLLCSRYAYSMDELQPLLPMKCHCNLV